MKQMREEESCSHKIDFSLKTQKCLCDAAYSNLAQNKKFHTSNDYKNNAILK
jgi:hypothetical protein